MLFLDPNRNKDISDYFGNDTKLFEKYAMHDYKRINKTTEYGMYGDLSFLSGLKFIAYEEVALSRMTGEFSAFCSLDSSI